MLRQLQQSVIEASREEDKLTVMQRPRIPPIIKFRRDIQRIEGRTDVTYHPKDQPHRRPRLTNDHRHVLTCQAERPHAEEVDHPVHYERRLPVRVRIVRHLCGRRGLLVEGDLEGERDHAVCERHGEVGAHGREPAVEDELVEVERRVAGGDEELHMRRHVEGEGEEGDDDQVDQPDSDCGKRDWRVERAEIEFRESDRWRQRLRGEFEVAARDAVICHYLSSPLGPEFQDNVRGNEIELHLHVGMYRIMFASFDIVELEGARRVVR